tara:strand:- start:2264 stop:3154 length:891 start_codon:yes stop_codon:yes gene_type:complete
MPNTINEYFQPSSTSSHSNIDDLILQAELDKFAQTGSMREDRTPRYIGGTDDVVANIALSPILTLKSMGNVGRKILEKTGLRNPVSHFTTGDRLGKILKQGAIRGKEQAFPGKPFRGETKYTGSSYQKSSPAVSVTRDPMFSNRPHDYVGTDVRLVMDRDKMIKKGLKMQPYVEVGGYRKTLDALDRIFDVNTGTMNPRFEFEERIRGNIPTENIKLIDILNVPTPDLFGGYSDIYNERLMSFLRALSKTDIPMIKSPQAERAFEKIPKSGLSELIQIKAPTYKSEPFKVSDYYSF